MTIVTTLITPRFTVHATDSFVTVAKSDGSTEIVEDQEPKLVRVPTWRGGISYWGLARFGSWVTLQWLREQAQAAGSHNSPGAFADELARRLNSKLKGLSFKNPLQAGLGLHFTAYECIDGYWVPELFLVSNWADPSYRSLRPGGFAATRETYGSLIGRPDRPDTDASPTVRRAVHAALHEQSAVFRFNNGDPGLFNPIADAIFDTAFELGRRSELREWSAETHRALARRPVEVVSKLLADFKLPGRRIGGKPHDLAISPAGEFSSSTGDATGAV